MKINPKNTTGPLLLILALVAAGLLPRLNGGKNSSGKPLNINSGLQKIEIDDPFWTPKFRLWKEVTVNDLLAKFGGAFDSTAHKDMINADGKPFSAYHNFDMVARGKRGTGKHDGPPWYDGLVYETITGACGFLIQFPDKKTEEKIDSVIARIEAAQKAGGDGYINTYTTLVEPGHRWGMNGGFERFQHDLYNSGALIEAGVSYYKATGKTRLLNVAVACANCICREIGPEPAFNVIPGHALPEYAMMELYRLFKAEPDLKKSMTVKVNETDYYNMARFWIEDRGNHCGLPEWYSWSMDECEKWIRDNKYAALGTHSRPSWGSYNQDHVSVFQQTTIEGHAVRATLFCTGLASVAAENHDPRYAGAASALWNNMTEKRTYLTGGVGVFSNEEMFGPDYVLPNDGYCETCAAVGSGFFSLAMSDLIPNGRYFDEFERALYNNVLSGISLSGDHYSYQNPLEGKGVKRWDWHPCPCCPPMFMKIMSKLPEYICRAAHDTISVNLYISSRAELRIDDKGSLVSVNQVTGYPWNGEVTIKIDPRGKRSFTVRTRVPGWAGSSENQGGLYRSDVKEGDSLKVNGKPVTANIKNGYAAITRTWDKGDIIAIQLPFSPRLVYADDRVKDLKGKVAIACGPVIYGFEECDNPDLSALKIGLTSPLRLTFRKDLLNGADVISGIRSDNEKEFLAVPFYAFNNRVPGNGFKVWTDF